MLYKTIILNKLRKMNLFKSLFISACFFASSFISAQTCTAAFTHTLNGNVVTFSNTSAYTPSSNPIFYWNFGNGVSYTTTATGTVSATYTVNSLYMLQFSCGNSTQIDSISVTVPGCPLSLGVVSSYTSNIGNAMINFSANAIGTTSNTTYLWDFDDGNISTSINPTHTYTLNGRYYYSLLATENPTCLARFNYNPFNGNGDIGICSITPTVSWTQGIGGNVNFVLDGFASSNNMNYIHWSFGDSPYSFDFGLQVNHVYFTGTYTNVVDYQLPFCFGLASSTAVITVSNNPCIVNSAFTSTVGAGGSVQFSPSVSPSGSNIAYAWNFGDGVISNAFSPTHAYASQGTYSVSLMVYNVTNSIVCQQTNTANVVVTGIPCLANSGFSLFPIIGQPHTYYITPNYPYNVSSAIWNWGDGSSSNTLYTSHTYSASGNYNICLTVTASCIASSSTCVNQFLAKQEVLNMISVSVQTPSLSTNIAIEKILDSNMEIFPNPNDGLFYIKSESPIALSDITVVDIMGKEISVLSINEEENIYRLKIGNVNDGVYFVKIKTPQKISRSRLIISK